MSKKTIDAIASEQNPQAETPEQELAPAITRDELEAMQMPADLPEKEQQERQPFRIADDDCADWAVKKIAEEKAEYERLKALGEREIERIKERIAQAENRYNQNTDFLKQRLGEYFGTVPHKCTKTTEKYKLLSGTLTLKYGGVDAKRDDATLVPFLRESGHEDLVKVEEKVAWGELKKLLTFAGDTAIMTDTGEIVPGLTIATKPDTFSVDV